MPYANCSVFLATPLHSNLCSPPDVKDGCMYRRLGERLDTKIPGDINLRISRDSRFWS